MVRLNFDRLLIGRYGVSEFTLVKVNIPETLVSAGIGGILPGRQLVGVGALLAAFALAIVRSWFTAALRALVPPGNRPPPLREEAGLLGLRKTSAAPPIDSPGKVPPPACPWAEDREPVANNASISSKVKLEFLFMSSRVSLNSSLQLTASVPEFEPGSSTEVTAELKMENGARWVGWRMGEARLSGRALILRGNTQ